MFPNIYGPNCIYFILSHIILFTSDCRLSRLGDLLTAFSIYFALHFLKTTMPPYSILFYFCFFYYTLAFVFIFHLTVTRCPFCLIFFKHRLESSHIGVVLYLGYLLVNGLPELIILLILTFKQF